MNQKVKKHLSKDPILKKVVKKYDYIEVPKSQLVFHELVRSIVHQQISVSAANSIHEKFIKLIGAEDYLPEDLLEFDQETLRTAGISGQKSGYILNIARYFMDHWVDEKDWDNYSDQEIIEQLTTIKGVGEWTVQMMLMFQLDRPDVFPSKDLGVQIAMRKLYNLKTEKKALIEEMEKIAEAWSPYRSYASRYLWKWKREN